MIWRSSNFQATMILMSPIFQNPIIFSLCRRNIPRNSDPDRLLAWYERLFWSALWEEGQDHSHPHRRIPWVQDSLQTWEISLRLRESRDWVRQIDIDPLMSFQSSMGQYLKWSDRTVRYSRYRGIFGCSRIQIYLPAREKYWESQNSDQFSEYLFRPLFPFLRRFSQSPEGNFMVHSRCRGHSSVTE